MKLARKHIILGVLLLCAGQAWGAPEIDITNYHSQPLRCTDGTYFYYATGTSIGRLNSADLSVADAGKDFGGTIGFNMCWAGQAAGEVYIQTIDSADSTYDLWRSADYGATATKVVDLGDDGGTQTPAVSLLPRGFTYDAVNSQYIIGEYNSAGGARVAGAANDRVRLLKSADGTTWTEVATWNNDGSTNNVTHIHAVIHANGKNYICFGDGNEKSAIMEWDGTSEITSNANLSTYADASILYTGTAQTGERYRTVDLLFTPTHMVWIADNRDQDGERGIFRQPISAIMTEASTERVSELPLAVDHDGYLGVRMSTTGNLYFHDMMVAASTDRQVHVYGSSDGGATWGFVAVIGMENDGADNALANFFEHSGTIYIPTDSHAAGKTEYDTIIVRETGASFTDDRPKILHPVYWVATAANGGAGANTGYSPGAPKLTLESLLEGNNITYGARIIIGAGTFNESAIIAAYDAHSAESAPNSVMVIEGQGATLTKLVHLDSDGGTEWINFADLSDTVNTTVVIKNIWFDDQKTAGLKTLGFGAVNDSMTVYVEDCKFTAAIAAAGFVFRANDNSTLILKKIWSELSTGAIHVRQNNATDANIEAYHSVFVGGARLTYTENGQLTLINCNHYNFGAYGVSNAATATLAPIIKNSIFVGDGSATAIIDTASLSEDGSTILNNVFYSCTTQSNIANISATNKEATDPLFVDAANSNFRLKYNSPARNAGSAVFTAAAYPGDYAGNMLIYGTAPDIGAYERKEFLFVEDDEILPRKCKSTDANCYVQP